MDDYFAEADEHIVAVRRCLLVLEGRIGGGPPPAVLEELFRSFHSLKGISAMVELHDAEALAHQMESSLRAVREGDIELTPASFETLLAGANALEEVIVARRTGAAPPPIGDAMGMLQAIVPAANTQTKETPRQVVQAAVQPGGTAPVWRVRFVPSPELVERGVKVDTIRTRLLQVGNILAVTPKVLPGGGISFEFDVQTDDEKSLAAWRDEGVSYEAATPAAPAATASASETNVAVAPRVRELAAGATTNFVRVDLVRLDDLMRLVGDLVVTRARLDDTLTRVEHRIPAREYRLLQEHDALMERQLRDLREGIMRVRLVPVGEIFRRIPFVVRDLARDSGKRITLDVAGQSTEIDKFLIERMLDPVLHLVRNAVSHGIERPEDRIAAGKPPEGTIRLAASTAGESIVVDISDDGAGIDVAAVAQRARAHGVHTGDGPIDARALLDIICTSGFSTRDEADRVSGRGVGMAVVRAAVEDLGGTLAVESHAGQGTTFTITLPLTLAITDAIIAHVGDQTFAIPQSAVREVIEVETASLQAIERNELLTYRGRALPMVRLARLFHITTAEKPRLHAIVVGTGLTAVGILFDRIAGHREIVVKTITDPLIRVEGVSGATELGDGRLVLILDAAALSRGIRDRSRIAEKALA